MNIRFLETVKWLAEFRSFRLTAEKMHMTPAAISNRIAAMEQELGFRLFERDPREVKLTAQGDIFLQGAREIVGKYEDLLQKSCPSESLKGAVRIGVVTTIAITLLPKIIETLREKFPKIVVSITTSSSRELLAKLDANELDIVLCIDNGRRLGSRVAPLCMFGFFWVAAPERFGFSRGHSLGKEELSSCPIISPGEDTRNHSIILEFIKAEQLIDPVIHFSNSLATTISMIKAGLGISVLPPVAIGEELKSGALTILDVTPDFPPCAYSVVYLEGNLSVLPPLVATIATAESEKFCGSFPSNIAVHGIC